MTGRDLRRIGDRVHRVGENGVAGPSMPFAIWADEERWKSIT